MNNVDIAVKILDEIKEKTGFSLSDMRKKDRSEPILSVRKLAMRRVRSEAGLTYIEMGKLFHRHYSNIIHMCKTRDRGVKLTQQTWQPISTAMTYENVGNTIIVTNRKKEVGKATVLSGSLMSKINDPILWIDEPEINNK